MRCKLLVFAEGMSIDNLSHQLTIYGVMDAIAAVAFPVVIPKAFIGAVFERDEAEPQDLAITLRISMDDMIAMQAPGHVAFADQTVARISAQVSGVFIPGPCRMAVSVLQGETELARYDVGVRLIPAAPQMVGEPVQAPGPVRAPAPTAALRAPASVAPRKRQKQRR